MTTRGTGKERRRAAGLSLPPLAVVVVAFFLPTVRACSDVYSPASYLAESWLQALWVVPPYLVAGLLLILTGLAFLRRAGPARWHEGVALAGLAAGYGGMVFLLVNAGMDGIDDSVSVAAITWLAFAGTVGMFVLAGALRRTGWDRWEGILTAWTAVALSLAPTYVGALSVGDLLFGGFLYLGAVVTVGALRSPRVQSLLAPSGRLRAPMTGRMVHARRV